MRRPILPPPPPLRLLLAGLVVLAGCGNDAERGYVVVRGFIDSARSAVCEPVTLDREVAVTELRGVSDSTWLVLDEAQRQVLLYDHDLHPVRELRYPAAGPGSLDAPVSAVPLGDTAVVVAERSGLRLVTLGFDGEQLASTPLDFVPHALGRDAGDAILVAALPFGDHPSTLLTRYADGSFEQIPVPVRRYPDMMVTAMANSAVLGTLPGGDVLVVHQFLEPRAYRLGVDGTIETLQVPTPDATLDQLDFVPTAPITQDQIPRMLTPALAMSIDPVRSEVYLLTRSGRTVDGRPERAILRLTDRLRLIESFTIPVAAGSMVYLPRREAALVVDGEDRFQWCWLPRSGDDVDPRAT